MKRSILFTSIAVVAIWAAISVNGLAQEGTVTTTVTGATGTISQLNYGTDGEVQGFLIGTNILLSFPANICGGFSTLGGVGNGITYSGTAHTSKSGFESVLVNSFTNNNTKAAYTAAPPRPTTYGPVAGSVKQLNYAADGSVDGFLFTPAGSASPIFISTAPMVSAILTPQLTVGGSISVTGTTSASLSACPSTATLETVDASSLTIGTQTIVIGGHR